MKHLQPVHFTHEEKLYSAFIEISSAPETGHKLHLNGVCVASKTGRSEWIIEKGYEHLKPSLEAHIGILY